MPLLEGANSFTFWARSSYGDTSEMGTANGSLDSAAPSISGEVSGSAGDGGWFVSEATVSTSAADPGWRRPAGRPGRPAGGAVEREH